jgi:hypothetical protein
MPVRTGAVDSHYLIFDDLQSACDDHEHTIAFKRYFRVTNSFAESFWMVRCLLVRKFLVQMNNGGSASSTPPRWFDRVEGPIDAPAVDIPWNQSSMSHHDSNMLSLCVSVSATTTTCIPATSYLDKPELRRDRMNRTSGSSPGGLYDEAASSSRPTHRSSI